MSNKKVLKKFDLTMVYQYTLLPIKNIDPDKAAIKITAIPCNGFGNRLIREIQQGSYTLKLYQYMYKSFTIQDDVVSFKPMYGVEVFSTEKNQMIFAIKYGYSIIKGVEPLQGRSVFSYALCMMVQDKNKVMGYSPSVRELCNTTSYEEEENIHKNLFDMVIQRLDKIPQDDKK